MIKKLLLLLCLVIATAAILLSSYPTQPVPKNIILFIGDGMGVQQITAAKVIKGALAIERCPSVALTTTWAANTLITDSAASGTAIATGVKTQNGMIGQDPAGAHLKTVLEVAEEKGKSTGLVSTCAVTHATPASFATHVPGRKQYSEIARQLAASEVDVLFGGGLDHFSSSNMPSYLSELEAKMPVIKTADEFRALGTPEQAAALLYPVHPPIAAERTISLKELTAKAIEILSQNEEGFFLMVEGSQIDWMGHQNHGTKLVAEVVDFDDAVGIGLDFAEANNETLVIITADHETGGFALLGGSVENKTVDETGFVHKKHTASMVPLFAFGPGSKMFGGIMDNTDIGKAMMKFIQASGE